MNSIISLWQVYLYQPLVNLLIYLYNTIANQNLGWAVIYLTLALRIVLLPFSILSERNKVIYKKMEEQISEAERVHRADPVYIKEYVRGLMKKYKIRPWAKTGELAIQLLVLILLYQVFITGIQGLQLSKILYPSVDYPGRINTIFLTVPYNSSLVRGHCDTGFVACPDVFTHQELIFDVAERSIIWAVLIAVILFTDILVSLKKTKRILAGTDLTYLLLFPLVSGLILWWLPMVKSLFILTSIAFSYVLSLLRVMFWGKTKDT